MNAPPTSFPRRILWYLVLGFSLYWLGNVLAVFPWLLSKAFGIIVMFLSIILWGYMAYYSLKHVPRKAWSRDTPVMAVCFLLTAVVQDYFLYAVYRGIPDELYEFSTFLAYGMVFLIPFLVRYTVLRKVEAEAGSAISNTVIIVTALIGICACIFTLWSIKFW